MHAHQSGLWNGGREGGMEGGSDKRYRGEKKVVSRCKSHTDCLQSSSLASFPPSLPPSLSLSTLLTKGWDKVALSQGDLHDVAFSVRKEGRREGGRNGGREGGGEEGGREGGRGGEMSLWRGEERNCREREEGREGGRAGSETNARMKQESVCEKR